METSVAPHVSRRLTPCSCPIAQKCFRRTYQCPFSFPFSTNLTVLLPLQEGGRRYSPDVEMGPQDVLGEELSARLARMVGPLEARERFTRVIGRAERELEQVEERFRPRGIVSPIVAAAVAPPVVGEPVVELRLQISAPATEQTAAAGAGAQASGPRMGVPLEERVFALARSLEDALVEMVRRGQQLPEMPGVRVL